MARSFKHRFKILTGPLAGQVDDGFMIGSQDFPDQYKSMDHESIVAHRNAAFGQGRGEGVWLSTLGQAVYQVMQAQGSPIRSITADGMQYGNEYLDMNIPFDRNGDEIKVDDMLYVAVKNEVRLVKVVAIAAKPFMASYGIIHRKLTVYDADEDRKLTINDPGATIKA